MKQGEEEFARTHGLPLCLCSGVKAVGGCWRVCTRASGGDALCCGPVGGVEAQRLGQGRRDKTHSSEPSTPRHMDEAINLELSL